MQIMLCGAHDTALVKDAFNDVVRQFGGEPWFYGDGTIQYYNSGTSSWSKNSKASVQRADLCVFVMLAEFGGITWSDELETALGNGTPFVIMARADTWQRYQTLTYSISDTAAVISEADRAMLSIVRKLTSDYNLTVVPFPVPYFSERLREQLARSMEYGLSLVKQRIQREQVIGSLLDGQPPTRARISALIDLVTDEMEENKLARKRALRRLADWGERDNEWAVDACRSLEQGVQRLAFELLPQIIELPADPDVLNEVISIAEQSDDVGLANRLALSIGALLPDHLDLLLESRVGNQEGLRRRVFEVIESREAQLLTTWGPTRLGEALLKCEGTGPTTSDWRKRCSQLRNRLQSGS